MNARVETLVLDDGRRAERHITVDENGNEIVEIFAEEKKPLSLEKRIKREYKQVVAKEVHEVIKDGEISQVEVLSTEPEIPLQVRERIGTVDHAKLVDGGYVKREELAGLVSEGVVSGISALLDNMNLVQGAKRPSAVVSDEPLTAQSVIEKNVESKKKNDMVTNICLAGIIIVQLAFFAYMFFAM